MEDTLSRYLNMRVILLFDYFREYSKRRKPRISIDRLVQQPYTFLGNKNRSFLL